MKTHRNYLLSLEDLVLFLNEEFKESKGLGEDIGLLRLNLSIYLLHAYYSSTYGRLPVSVEGVCENNISYPKYLVDVEFKSGTYGVTIKGVKGILEKTSTQEGKKFDKDKLNIDSEAGKHDLMLYLKEITNSINGVSEFSLVERVHEDKVWFKAFNNNNGIIDNEELVDEYYNNYGIIRGSNKRKENEGDN